MVPQRHEAVEPNQWLFRLRHINTGAKQFAARETGEKALLDVAIFKGASKNGLFDQAWT